MAKYDYRLIGGQRQGSTRHWEVFEEGDSGTTLASCTDSNTTQKIVAALNAESDALATLRQLGHNPHLSLGDMTYTVRDNEALGWDGPAVKAWAAAVAAAERLVGKWVAPIKKAG